MDDSIIEIFALIQMIEDTSKVLDDEKASEFQISDAYEERIDLYKQLGKVCYSRIIKKAREVKENEY